jgi:phosphoglycerate dehydrogenase-like enzyme
MTRLRVLEWVRGKETVWTLPPETLDPLRREFPDVRFDCPPTRDEAEALLPETDIVLGFVMRPENFAAAKRLKWIHMTAAGIGHALFPALVESDVIVTNARGMHAVSIAEHTLGAMLGLARKLHLARDEQHRKRWTQVETWKEPPLLGELRGATLGLVGFGRIGHEIAVRAKAFGMRVLAVRRHPATEPAPADTQWGMERLDEMLGMSDWIVICAAHTPETDRLIDAGRFARMKHGATLVNIARGAIVDEHELIEALRSGQIAAAALDVMEREPLPEDSPLWSMPNVIVTPHVSGMGPRYWERSVEMFGDNLRRYVAGEELFNVVDKRAGY